MILTIYLIKQNISRRIIPVHNIRFMQTSRITGKGYNNIPAIVNIGIAEFIKISSIGRLKTDKIRVLDQAPLTFFDISDRNRGFKASLKQYVGI